MEERSKDLKAIVTERYQIPSQMPFAYASGLERGAARDDRSDDVKPVDSMTWQFFGGTLDPDPAKRSWENMVFFFAMDPHRIRTMMDDLEVVDPELIEKMAKNKKAALIGREKLASIKKRVGDRFVLTGLNYKGIDLEFEVIGMLPEGRYNQNAIMNRDYLNDALDGYASQHRGEKHPMAMKTLNLVWLRVPDPVAFQKVADQVTCRGIAALPAPGIKGANLVGSFEAVVADRVECLRQIELVRQGAAVVVHLGPVIGHQPIERIPQRRIIGVQHLLCDPPRDELRRVAPCGHALGRCSR